MLYEKFTLTDEQLKILNEYTLTKNDNIEEINNKNIHSLEQKNLLSKSLYFFGNLKFHTEEEMLQQYGFTFNDLQINKYNSDLFKIAFLSFLFKDNPSRCTKDYVILKDDPNYLGKKKISYNESTFRKVQKILQSIGNNRSMIIPTDKYYTTSNQERLEIEVHNKYGEIFTLRKEDRKQQYIKSIYVISLEIDLHEDNMPQTEEEKQNIINKRNKIKEILKQYDLPGTVNYTTNRSVYMQYTLNHSVTIDDAKMIKAVLIHRLYTLTGLNADIANMSPSILHHAKLTKHTSSNMESIVAPYLWYDMPYDTGKMLKYCKQYIKDNKENFENYFKQTPEEKKLSYLKMQLEKRICDLLMQDDNINEIFTYKDLCKYIQTIFVDIGTFNESNLIYGFNTLYDQLIYKTRNKEEKCTITQQQNNIINIINFLQNDEAIINIGMLYEDYKNVHKYKMAYELNDIQLKQIVYNINIKNNYLLSKALEIRQNITMLKSIKNVLNASPAVLEYCLWFKDFFAKSIYEQIDKIVINRVQQETKIEEIIQSKEEHKSTIIEFDWKDSYKIIRTSYISIPEINIVKSYNRNYKKIINIKEINEKNEINYFAMLDNLLNDQVIPSKNFKLLYRMSQKYKINILTIEDIKEIKQIFNLPERMNKRTLNTKATIQAILRELGNKLHNLCDLNLSLLTNKKSIKHQFYTEHRPSMIFNTNIHNNYAQCTIESFHSFNTKPSGSIIDLITWCFADSQITYYEARKQAIYFCAAILNINIVNSKQIKNDVTIFDNVINKVNKLFEHFITLLNNHRNKKNTSAQDLELLKNLILTKIIDDSNYDSNRKNRANTIHDILYNTQTLITTTYLKNQFGWSKNKSSYLMNTLLCCNLFQQIKDKNDIACVNLKRNLDPKHNIPFILTLTDFNKTFYINNRKSMTNYKYSLLCMKYLFILEESTKKTINNWTAEIKNAFNKITALIRLNDKITNNIVYMSYSHDEKQYVQIKLNLYQDLINQAKTFCITTNIYDQKNKLINSKQEYLNFYQE